MPAFIVPNRLSTPAPPWPALRARRVAALAAGTRPSAVSTSLPRTARESFEPC